MIIPFSFFSKPNVTITTPTSSGVDYIKTQLTASLSAYNAASVNDWVKITSTEYSNIFTNIAGATKKGNTDTQINTRAVASGYTEAQFSINNVTGSALTISANEYPIAFATETWNGNANVQFGYSTAFHSGAPTYGNSVTVTPVGACYYVRKAPTGVESAPATQTLYPSLKISTNTFNCVPNTSGWVTANGGTTWIGVQGSVGGGAPKFQMIVTTTKSW